MDSLNRRSLSGGEIKNFKNNGPNYATSSCSQIQVPISGNIYSEGGDSMNHYCQMNLSRVRRPSSLPGPNLNNNQQKTMSPFHHHHPYRSSSYRMPVIDG